MTKVGWFLLLLFVLAAVAVGLMLNFGGRVREEAPRAAPTTASMPAGDLVLPVAGVQPNQLTDTWGQSREGGAREHHAIDIMAPRGTPVVAAAPGRIEKIFESKPGGHTVYVRSDDGGIVYYYAHLDGYRAGLAEGQRVGTGDVIGTVGSTGNASAEAPHLHFEIKRMARGEGWWQGQNVNPYPLLTAR